MAKNKSYRTDRQNMRLILFILCTCLCIALLVAIPFGISHLFREPEDDGRILPNVTAGGVNIGGMTPEEATNALRLSVADTIAHKDLVVELPGTSLTLSPGDTEAQLDVKKLVDAAYSYGRTGSALERKLARAKAETTPYILPLLPYLRLDRDYIQSAVRDFCNGYSINITQPSAVITGERPVYTPPQKEEAPEDEEDKPGNDQDDKPQQDEKPDPNEKPGTETEEIPDPNANVTHQVLTITTGTPQFVLESDDLYDAILDAYSLMELKINYKAPNRVEPDKLDLRALFATYCVLPKDAVMDEKTFQITPEVVGYGFDIAAVQEAIDKAGYGQTITITLGFLMPDITEQSFGELFQDVLAAFTSIAQSNTGNTTGKPNDPDDKNNEDTDGTQVENPNKNRDENLKISCEAINGTVIKPGEVFDFNKILGPRTSEKGYLSAPNYEGSTLSSVGGGISQTASALHYCAMLAGLQVNERHAHPFTVSYTPLGTDAAITYGKENLVFTNTTTEPIRVLAKAEDGRVTIQLLGTETREYTPMVEVDIKNIQEPETIYQSMDKNNVYGYKDGQVLQAAHTGYTIQVYYCRYDTETKTLIGRDLLYTIRYEKRDQVVVRIEGSEPEPSTPDPSTPKPSTPKPSTGRP